MPKSTASQTVVRPDIVPFHLANSPYSHAWKFPHFFFSLIPLKIHAEKIPQNFAEKSSLEKYGKNPSYKYRDKICLNPQRPKRSSVQISSPSISQTPLILMLENSHNFFSLNPSKNSCWKNPTNFCWKIIPWKIMAKILHENIVTKYA